MRYFIPVAIALAIVSQIPPAAAQAPRGGDDQGGMMRPPPGPGGPGERGGPGGGPGGRPGEPGRGMPGGMMGRGDRARAGGFNVRPEQRERFAGALRGRGFRPIPDLGVRLAVGAFVARRDELRPLPPDLIDIVPEYRGYLFAETPDGVAIVDPETFEIVDVLPL